MRDRRGYTFVEMMVTVALLALIAGLAGIAGVKWVVSARMAKGASQVADAMSLARENAIARHERWRVRFEPGSADVVRVFVLESCTLRAGDPVGADCITGWVESKRFETEPAIGLRVPLEGGQPISLVYDRNGRFLTTVSPPGSNIEIEVCNTMTDSSGAAVCRPGSTARLIRIRPYSGIIES